jgi:uncharacterized Zn-binding protein involved in type VI secretion
MTADPSLPDPRMDALEARVADLEEYQGQVLPFVQAATGTAVARLHGDLRALQQEATRHGQRLDQVEAGLATVERLQIEHGAALGTVAGNVDGLERKVGALERKLDAHGDVLASVASTVSSQGEMLASHGEMLASQGEMLASHGEMLTEILRRLPPAPDGE